MNGLRWWGWGTVDRGFPEATVRQVLGYLQRERGFVLRDMPAVALEKVALPEIRMAASARQALLPAVETSASTLARLSHAYGKSYSDLVRLRRGEVPHPPDLVGFPRSADEVVDALRVAADYDVAVIPYGGGTSVVGGVEPIPRAGGTLTLDLRRLNRLLDIDTVSNLATFEAGVLGPDLEAILRSYGYTLEHFPQSFEYSTLGGWIATRSAGQNSAGVGRIEDLVESLEAAVPAGRVATPQMPAMAMGPSLKELWLGSEGALGVITQATVRIHRPQAQVVRTAIFPDWELGCAAVHAMAQDEAQPTLLRLSDAAETEMSLRGRAPDRAPFHRVRKRFARWMLEDHDLEVGQCCLLLIAAPVEGSTWRRLQRHIERHDGFVAGEGPGRQWLETRFTLPFLRDVLMDHGVLIDTLETSARWSRLPQVYDAARHAFKQALGATAVVLCHISHIYADGASLYFTFMAPRPATGELELWDQARRRAVEAFLASGGALSHHHGVGLMQAPWLGQALGGTAVGVLRAVKTAVDPSGILNPGKLLPIVEAPPVPVEHATAIEPDVF